MAFGDLIVYSTLAVVLLVLVGRSKLGSVFTLTPLFGLAQWQTAVGTLLILDPGNTTDQKYAYVVTLPLLVYCTVSVVGLMMTPSGALQAINRDEPTRILKPGRGLYALLALSIVITVAYFQSVGYNVFTLAIRNMLSGGADDYTTLRLDSYGGSRYLFPGYVNQFKNAIMPALAVVIGAYAYSSRRPWRHLFAVVMLVVVVFGIMGTGQRSALFMFFVTGIVFVRFLEPRKFKRRLLILAGVTVPLLMLGTVILGRSSSELEAASGTRGRVAVLGSELLKRLFYDNQFSGQAAFHYTEQIGIQDGAEWLKAVLGILPNQEGTRLARDVFKALYGTDRGTAPPSLWGSAHFNFGLAGTMLFAMLLGIIFLRVSRATTRRLNTLELMGAAGVTAVTANWVASGPEFLLNTGVVTYAILWYMGSRAQRQLPAGDGAEPDPGPNGTASLNSSGRFVTRSTPLRATGPRATRATTALRS